MAKPTQDRNNNASLMADRLEELKRITDELAKAKKEEKIDLGRWGQGEPILTMEESAKAIGVVKNTIQYWVRMRYVRHARGIDGRIYIPVVDLITHQKKRNAKARRRQLEVEAMMVKAGIKES